MCLATQDEGAEKRLFLYTMNIQTLTKLLLSNGSISNIYNKAISYKQNQLLWLLITDCQLNGKKLEYKIKATFDNIIMCKNYKNRHRVTIYNL